MTEPIDISPNVANLLITESVGNIQATNAIHRDTTSVAVGVLKSGAAQNFTELSPAESRSVSGVLATPLAAPTVGG